jgi:hypothetical protein
MNSSKSEPSLHRILAAALSGMENTHPLQVLLPLANEIERICSIGDWTLIELQSDMLYNQSGHSQVYPGEFSFRLRFTAGPSLGRSDSEKP